MTRCWFTHAYRVVAARSVRVVGEFGDEWDATRVLRVCDRCGKARTKRLKGTWTLEQVTGDAS